MYFWILLIIVILILIIWATTSTKETHIHHKPHYDQIKNTITYRTSLHVKKSVIFKRVLVTDENKESLWKITKSENGGTDTGLVMLVEIPSTSISGMITVPLPPLVVVEPSQLEIHSNVNGNTEVTLMATATLKKMKTYIATVQEHGSIILTGSINADGSINTEGTGHFYFNASQGSKITILDLNGNGFPPDSLTGIKLLFCGIFELNQPCVVNQISTYDSSIFFGGPPCNNGTSVRNCVQLLGSPPTFFPCGLCDATKNTTGLILTPKEVSNVTIGIDNLVFEPGFKFRIQIDETDLVSCGFQC